MLIPVLLVMRHLKRMLEAQLILCQVKKASNSEKRRPCRNESPSSMKATIAAIVANYVKRG